MGTRMALFLAVILGVVAALASRMWLQTKETELEERVQNVAIVVAKENLPQGQPLRRAGMTYDLVPKSSVVAGMIPAGDARLHEGKILLRSIRKGEPIFKSFLDTDLGAQVTQKSLVNEKMRALTLRVDQVDSVSYMIRPGDYIDIFATFDITTAVSSRTAAGSTTSGSTSGRVVRTLCLMEAVKVIAVDNRPIDVAATDRTHTQYRTLTLEVDPVSAGRLINAKQQGTIQFVLRARRDQEPALAKYKEFRWQDMQPATAEKP